MKKIIYLILSFVVSLPIYAAEELPIGQLINLGARQRALSQKALKSWILKSENILKDGSAKEQLNATNLFEQSLELIMEKVPNEFLKLQYKKVENQWVIFKKLIEDEKNINYVATLSAGNYVLSSCDEALKATVKYAKELKENKTTAYDFTAVTNNTEICAKQRLLTQRLVVYYTLHFTGKGANLPVNKSTIGILEELNDNFKRLMVSEVNSGDIADELSNIMVEWKKTYEQLRAYNYEAIELKKMPVENLFENMNKLYNKFDKLVAMYSNLLKN